MFVTFLDKCLRCCSCEMFQRCYARKLQLDIHPCLLDSVAYWSILWVWVSLEQTVNDSLKRTSCIPDSIQKFIFLVKKCCVCITHSFTIVYCKIVHLDLLVFIQLLYCKFSCFICFFLVFQNSDKSRKRFCQDPFKVATACLTAFCLILLMILAVTSVQSGTSHFSLTVCLLTGH